MVQPRCGGQTLEVAADLVPPLLAGEHVTTGGRLGRHGLTRATGDDEDHRTQDDPAGDQRAEGVGLARQRPAEQHRHGGIDVGVGTDHGGRDATQEPAIGGEGDQRAGREQVEEGQHGRSVDLAPGDPGGLTQCDGEHEEPNTTAQHLHAGSDQGPVGRVVDPGAQRAGRPGERAQDRQQHRAELPRTAGLEQQADPEQADPEPDPGTHRQALTEDAPCQQRQPDRHGGQQQAGGTRGDAGLRQGDQAGTPDHQQVAGHEGLAPVPQGDAVTDAVAEAHRDEVQQASRQQKPTCLQRERRQRDQRHLSGEQRRSPDEVHGAERDRDLGDRRQARREHDGRPKHDDELRQCTHPQERDPAVAGWLVILLQYRYYV